MAIYRQIQTSFWNDGFVIELTPEEKYFYFYLMTNPKSTQCGIFELPKRMAEMETGYNRDTVDKLLKKFIDYGKILYCEETREIMIINWMKYNFINSKNTILCINKELKGIKNKEFISRIYKICLNLGYAVESIFQGIILAKKERSKAAEDNEEIKDNDIHRDLKGPCKPLGEEEIKEETYTKKESLNNQKVINDNKDNTDKVLIEFNKNMRKATFSDIEKIKFLRKEFQDEVIIQAIYKAVECKAAHPAYIWSVLKSWRALGLFTLDKLKIHIESNKSSGKGRKFNGCNAAAYRYVD